MRASSELPLGVAALFGEEARRRRRLEQQLAGDLESAGFQEVILPILDFAEPYEPLLSAGSRAELYRFSGRDGELLALRADFTPMLARLLAPRLGALELPLRLFYRGDVVRFQEARVGRQRELYQLGAEILGPAGAAGEEEALRLFLQLLGGIAGQPVRVVMGVAGALDGLLLAAPEPAALARAVARRERSAARQGGAALLQVVEDGTPADLQALGPAAAAVEALLQARQRLSGEVDGVEITVDLAEFAQVTRHRTLEQAAGARSYYDGLVFRAYLGGASVPVGGGGRYDRLFERLGAPVPAVGFSFGLDRLAFANGTVGSRTTVTASCALDGGEGW